MKILYSQINEIDDLLDDEETYNCIYDTLLAEFGEEYGWESIEDVKWRIGMDSTAEYKADKEAYRIAKDIVEEDYYEFVEPWLKNIFKTKTIVYGIGRSILPASFSEEPYFDAAYGYDVADTYTDFWRCISNEYDEMEIIKQDDGLIVFGGTIGNQVGRNIAIRAMTREGAKYFNDCTTSRTHFDMDDLLDEIFTSDEYSENVEEFKY